MSAGLLDAGGTVVTARLQFGRNLVLAFISVVVEPLQTLSMSHVSPSDVCKLIQVDSLKFVLLILVIFFAIEMVYVEVVVAS